MNNKELMIIIIYYKSEIQFIYNVYLIFETLVLINK